jgi:hypothetical protein
MAEKKKVITNQAEIDAANRENVAKSQQKAAAESRAAAAFEKGRPIITQALSGVGGLNKALQAQIKAAENLKVFMTQLLELLNQVLNYKKKQIL